jgi:hypothetical protein
MRFHPWADFLMPAFPRHRSPQPRMRCACRRPARTRLALEALEDRTVLSGSPVPIPGGLLVPNPFGGPDVHFHKPGPADSSKPNKVGGDPSTIDNFNGFVGVAHVQGTGTDNNGDTLFWDADLRFMDGVFKASDGSTQQGTFAFV